ncbi:XRE family transcriptional regulator [Paenimyroides tangerinum]|uniref:XRE family transcriptional regulator n=1 Tax=Paenimyroides tangerinum TaxID=2488728 RepID=A0A3P3W236_9FLAO|nr:helix-turn-helix transcriptional regulator [Paenimyroides tangerinum]RRJ89105.1 XRE family transcriptional regulator [Paenimyroides tangerinum]
MKLNRLKVILAEHSKTSKWLAKELGKSESTVSRWCTNEIQPSVETFAQIARLLKVDIKDFFNSTMLK